jgi:Flp pilus assembly protein CpaB
MPPDAPSGPDPVLEVLRRRLRALLRPVRRRVLARRRLLAAGCVGVAVLAGLRATSAPPPATVAVPVLARDVPAGTVLTPADLRSAAFSPATVPDGVVADPTGQMVAAAIGRGEPVTATRLLGPGLSDGLLAETGLVAMPVRFPDAAMAALLRVGDTIDVLAIDPQGGAPALVSGGVQVLALPSAPDSGVGVDGLQGRLVVLAVAADDVTGVADASVRLFLTYAYDG